MLLGLGIVIDTSSFTLFVYSLFAKIVSIRLMLSLIFCCITKNLKLDNLSLSLSSVLLMFFMGGIHYFYVIPFFKINLSLALMHLKNAGKHVHLFCENFSK